MMYRWEVVLMAVVCTLGLPATVLPSDLKSKFCSQTNQDLRCVFRNTSENVDLAVLWPGVRKMQVEVTESLYGSVPCGATLEVWSSSNVTLQGHATGHAHNKTPESHQGTAFNGRETGRGGLLSRSSSALTRSNKLPLSNSSPPTPSSGSATHNSGLPTRNSGPPTHNSSPPTRNSGFPTSNSGPQTRKSGLPTGNSGPPTRNTGPPTRNTGPPTRNTGPPTRNTGHLPGSRGSLGVAPHFSTTHYEREESVPYGAGEARCSSNVSITQARVHSLLGEFDVSRLYYCNVDELDGQFGLLNIRKSDVSNFSASGRQAYIEDSTMLVVSSLAMNQLQLNHVKIGRLVSPGLVQQTTGSEVVSNLSEVTADIIETGAILVVSGQLTITNMTVNEMQSAAITVGSGGVLTLTNFHVRQGPQTMLVLDGEGKVAITNFTLGNDTIIHLELTSRSNQKTLYPLHIMRPAEVSNTSKIGGFTGTSHQVEKTPVKNLVGFSWYWVMIMTVAGVFAGMIIGTAIMWRRPTISKCPPSALTLSDLIAQDRLDSEDHAPDTPQRPELSRQDSGLTSSSFASFTPCQERSRLSSLSMRQQQDPDVCLSTSTEPNIYVHVPALACTREDVIYEEVETLGVPKVDPTYLIMN
ncbi:uncharacterized protein [Procambarus clarkii]|uniref:uncharacterized protein isoform X1 n=2 Tax=Procambarus clarkii TaxID=6728 RepID=UPI003741F4B4